MLEIRCSPTAEAEQSRVAVDLFHRRRVLLVWDNFESTLPADIGCQGAR